MIIIFNTLIKIGYKIQSTHTDKQQRFDESSTWRSLISKTLNLDPRTYTWDNV